MVLSRVYCWRRWQKGDDAIRFAHTDASSLAKAHGLRDWDKTLLRIAALGEWHRHGWAHSHSGFFEYASHCLEKLAPRSTRCSKICRQS